MTSQPDLNYRRLCRSARFRCCSLLALRTLPSMSAAGARQPRASLLLEKENAVHARVDIPALVLDVDASARAAHITVSFELPDENLEAGPKRPTATAAAAAATIDSDSFAIRSSSASHGVQRVKIEVREASHSHAADLIRRRKPLAVFKSFKQPLCCPYPTPSVSRPAPLFFAFFAGTRVKRAAAFATAFSCWSNHPTFACAST
jgi:hypothetical protein